MFLLHRPIQSDPIRIRWNQLIKSWHSCSIYICGHWSLLILTIDSHCSLLGLKTLAATATELLKLKISFECMVADTLNTANHFQIQFPRQPVSPQRTMVLTIYLSRSGCIDIRKLKKNILMENVKKMIEKLNILSKSMLWIPINRLKHGKCSKEQILTLVIISKKFDIKSS